MKNEIRAVKSPPEAEATGIDPVGIKIGYTVSWHLVVVRETASIISPDHGVEIIDPVTNGHFVGSVQTKVGCRVRESHRYTAYINDLPLRIA